MPASRCGWRRPACRAIAPPCEKPASAMRRSGTPRSTSRAMSAPTSAVDAAMPARSCGAPVPIRTTSNQARIG